MKKTILWAAFCACVFTTMVIPVMAALPPTRSGGQSGSLSTTFDFLLPFNQATKTSATRVLIDTGHENMISNGDFEAATYNTGWTASGGSVSQLTGSSALFGSNSLQWDSNAASQTLTSSLTAVPKGMFGEVCELSFRAFAAGSATHTYQAWNGTSGVGTARTINAPTGNGNRRQVTYFTCPTSGSIGVRLTSVASNEPAIDLDDFYIGPVKAVPTTREYAFIDTDSAPDRGKLVMISSASGGGGPNIEATTIANLGAGTRNAWVLHKNGTSQSLSTGGSGSLVTFSTAAIDTSSSFDNANDRITPGAGYFFMHALITLNTCVDTAVVRAVIRKNGNSIAQGDFHCSTAKVATAVMTALAESNGSGDYFDVVAFQDSGGSIDISGSSNSTNFIGFRIF